MNTKLASINLEVADPERSQRFYTEALGMVEDPRRSHPPGFRYLSSAGCDLTLALPAEAGPPEPSRTMEIGFEVDDLEAFKRHLDASGFGGYREQSMGWGEALELLDPDGHRVIVYRFKDGGP